MQVLPAFNGLGTGMLNVLQREGESCRMKNQDVQNANSTWSSHTDDHKECCKTNSWPGMQETYAVDLL